MERPAPFVVDRPLRLGEVLREAIQVYGKRPIAYVSIGLLQSAGFLIARVVPWYVQLVVLAAAFVVSFAMIVRLVAGDTYGAAFARLARDALVLVPLALVVAMPFVIAGFIPVFIVVSIVWLGLTGYAIPALSLDEYPYRGPFDRAYERLTAALRRTVFFAQADFVHSIGVALTLVLVDWLVGVVLALALFSFADQGQLAAVATAQAVLSPFLFIGLTVLYLEQRIRAEEGKRPKRRR